MSISPNFLDSLRYLMGSSIEAPFGPFQVPVKTLQVDPIEAPEMTLSLEHCSDGKVSLTG